VGIPRNQRTRSLARSHGALRGCCQLSVV
jgi:hypothetical protein